MLSVRLDELSIVHLRNIRSARIEPCPRFNVISGRNGMGKSNLIEGIYLLGALRSFRTAVRGELLMYGEERARVTSLFGDAAAGIRCEMTWTRGERTVTVDGKDVTATGMHFQMLPMVLFHPAMMDIVQGGPEIRRRFLDRAMFQADGRYPSIYRAYQRVLANRNRLLRDGRSDQRALAPFDTQLADAGSRMVSMRAEFVDQMQPFFKDAAERISEGGVAEMTYRPSIRGAQEEYARVLADKAGVDRERRFTTAGPHADDLVFLMEGHAARRYASQGQQRTLVLAAKIAETRALADCTGRIPLLLFDDVSSELDRDRNRHLFAFLQSMGGQVFITTTHRDYIHIDEHRADYSVVDGTFIPG